MRCPVNAESASGIGIEFTMCCFTMTLFSAFHACGLLNLVSVQILVFVSLDVWLKVVAVYREELYTHMGTYVYKYIYIHIYAYTYWMGARVLRRSLNGSET